MAHGQVTVPVAGELRSVATDGRTVAAEGVYDYNLQKTQEQINQELMNGAGGGSQPVDAYTKQESDGKYATKTEVNTVSGNVNSLNGTVNTLSGNVSTLSGNVGTLSNTVNQMASSPNNKPTINKTWAEMIALKNSNGFIPGQTYRITDYQTMGKTNVQNIMIDGYAGHPFDVIVTALTSNSLSEDAKAAKRTGDSYFANCNLDAWELKYVLDPANDNRFYHDNENFISDQTKGWIYYMKDEHFNSANFDFKNILLEGVKVSSYKYGDYIWEDATTREDELNNGEWFPKYVCSGKASATDYATEVWKDCITVDSADTKLFYMFSYLNQDGSVVDASVVGVQGTFPLANVISVTSFGGTTKVADLRPVINIFICDWAYTEHFAGHVVLPSFNTFGQTCSGNTFGCNCRGNKFGDWSNCNVFGSSVLYNTFNSIRYCCFGNNTEHNEIDRALSVQVGCMFAFNDILNAENVTAGNEFVYNHMEAVRNVTIGDHFTNNYSQGVFVDSTIGDDCNGNIFEWATQITLGHTCRTNRFHGNCLDITLGNQCQNNIFDGATNHIKMGDRCLGNHIEKQNRWIVFGSSEEDVKGYYCGCTIRSYNDHIALNATGTLSASSRFMGIKIDTRTHSPYYNDTSISEHPYKVISNAETEQGFTTTYTSENSKTITV